MNKFDYMGLKNVDHHSLLVICYCHDSGQFRASEACGACGFAVEAVFVLDWRHTGLCSHFVWVFLDGFSELNVGLEKTGGLPYK